jgi:hypothetical protein
MARPLQSGTEFTELWGHALVNSGKHSPKRVVGKHAMAHIQKLLKPGPPSLPKQLNIGPGFCPTDNPTYGHDDIDQLMVNQVFSPWVLQPCKVLGK